MKTKLSQLKSNNLKLLAFLTDATLAIVTQIIALSSDEPSEAASDAAVAFFAIFGAIYLIVGIAYMFRSVLSGNCCQGVKEHAEDFLVLIAGFWYFFTDNFTGLVTDHGSNLGFSPEMITNVALIQPVLIVVVLILYRAETFHAHKRERRESAAEVELKDDKQKGREMAGDVELKESNDEGQDREAESKNNSHDNLYTGVIESLQFTIEFDALFTIAVIAAERSTASCPRVVHAFIWLLYAFLLLVSFIITTGSITHFVRKLKKLHWHHIIFNYTIAVFITLCLGFYLLGDNVLPLACAGGSGIIIVRLVFLVIALAIYVTLIAIRVCKAKY